MPVEQAILDRFLDPGLAALTPRGNEKEPGNGPRSARRPWQLAVRHGCRRHRRQHVSAARGPRRSRKRPARSPASPLPAIRRRPRSSTARPRHPSAGRTAGAARPSSAAHHRGGAARQGTAIARPKGLPSGGAGNRARDVPSPAARLTGAFPRSGPGTSKIAPRLWRRPEAGMTGRRRRGPRRPCPGPARVRPASAAQFPRNPPATVPQQISGPAAMALITLPGKPGQEEPWRGLAPALTAHSDGRRRAGRREVTCSAAGHGKHANGRSRPDGRGPPGRPRPPTTCPGASCAAGWPSCWRWAWRGRAPPVPSARR